MLFWVSFHLGCNVFKGHWLTCSLDSPPLSFWLLVHICYICINTVSVYFVTLKNKPFMVVMDTTLFWHRPESGLFVCVDMCVIDIISTHTELRQCLSRNYFIVQNNKSRFVWKQPLILSRHTQLQKQPYFGGEYFTNWWAIQIVVISIYKLV